MVNATPLTYQARNGSRGAGGGSIGNSARQLLVLVLVSVVVVQLFWQAAMLSSTGTPPATATAEAASRTAAAAVAAVAQPLGELLVTSWIQELQDRGAASAAQPPGWVTALQMLRDSETKYVIVDVKNGLGNRLRALASAMSVAVVLNRPLLLIWVSDLHCNCSFRRLFAWPLPFALLEEAIPLANLTSLEPRLQMYNYMRPEPGAVKDAPILPDPAMHIYFKSGFVMNHPYGRWKYAQEQIQLLRPAEAIADRLIADKSMVGVHIRNVFDAPRDEATAKAATGDKLCFMGTQVTHTHTHNKKNSTRNTQTNTQPHTHDTHAQRRATCLVAN